MAGNPGQKNRYITLLTPTEVNNFGDVTVTYTELASVWANERPLRMDERYAAEGKHSVRVSNFRIYYRTDVHPNMMLRYDNLDWRITGIAEVGYHEEMDITAEVVY